MNDSLNDFLNYLEYERNYSNNTVIAYKANIEKLIEYLDSNNIKSFKEVKYETIRNYLSFLYNEKYKAKSIARIISSMRSFFKYLKSINIIDDNPMTLISNPKVEKKLPKYLTINDVEKILNAPDMNDPVGIRDAFILELLYVTGIRVSEMVNIKINDIEPSLNRIKIMGKGSKERYVLYGSRCKELMNKYINVRNTFIKSSIDYLILSKTGRKINPREVRNIIDKIKTKAGIDMKISPHTFRHTFATHMLNEGADLRAVQELLGHENLSTTTIYTHLTNEKLRRTYLNTHPRA